MSARRIARRTGRGVLATVGAIFAAIALYAVVALAGGVIPRNAAFAPAPGGIDVVLRSNGVHVDLVVPVVAGGVDWRQDFAAEAETLAPAGVDRLAFGWGDRDVYLATPTWADLRISSALWALTGFDATVMHVEAAAVPYGANSRHVSLTNAQYRRLAQAIRSSFRKDALGRPIPVPGAYYRSNDVFFEANGHYSAGLTCNEWTRRMLASAGVRVPLWSPFALALLYQLPAEPAR